MERSLLWGALILGSAGWVCGLLVTVARRAQVRRGPAGLFLATAGALSALSLLLTFPGRPLVPAGRDWGPGLFLGGIGAIISVLLALRMQDGDKDPLHAATRVTHAAFLAVALVAGAMLWMGRSMIVDTLTGIATGWVSVSFILFAGLPQDEAVGAAAGPAAALLAAAGFAVTVCAAGALGRVRDLAASGDVLWMATAVTLGAGVPFVLLAVGAAASLASRLAPLRRLRAGGWWLLLGAALLVEIGNLLAVNLLHQPLLRYAVAAGLAIGYLVWWLVADAARAAAAQEAPSAAGAQVDSALAVLVALTGLIGAFYLLTGYGIGMALLAAWLPAGSALAAASPGRGEPGTAVQDGGPAAADLVRVLLFGVTILLYRLFTERFADQLSGATLTDHFALFSVLVGAALPALLAGVLRPAQVGGSAAGAVRLARLFIAVVAGGAAAALMLVLWGTRSGIGLLAGLSLAVVLDRIAGRSARRTDPDLAMLPAWLALLVSMAIVLWTGPVLSLAVLTRVEKVRLVVWLAGLLILALVVADAGERLRRWKGARRGQTGAAAALGGTGR